MENTNTKYILLNQNKPKVCYLEDYSFVSTALILRSTADMAFTSTELKKNRVINGSEHTYCFNQLVFETV